jgi:hypothetical protein
MEASVILHLKTTVPAKSRDSDAVRAAAGGPRAPSGSRGWQAVVSAGGSTTLWRRRGRIASVRAVRRDT